jgi:hypothetical protein
LGNWISQLRRFYPIFYAKDKANTSTPDQRSQDDEERYYDEFIKRLGKDELEERASKEMKKSTIMSPIQRLGQERVL